MKVREIMKSPVHTCQPLDSLEIAAQKLWDHDCGVLPVVDEQGRIGATITDRDVCMAAFTRGARLGDLRVGGAMSKSLVTCRGDEDVSVAAKRMCKHKVRRLPVVDENERVCGMLSLNDLAAVGVKNASVGREAMKVLCAVGSRHMLNHTKPKSKTTEDASTSQDASSG